MAKPQSKIQTQKLDPIYPKTKRAYFFGGSRFDQVWRLLNGSTGRYKQMYADLPGISNDQKYFEKITSRFGFELHEYIALIDPTMKKSVEMAQALNRIYKENPQETIFTLLCFATHGMIQDGRQVVIVNEINKARGFYTFYGAEQNMRDSAFKFPNAYIVGVFACCREIFLVTQHSGGISL